jgi:hypothetical protein
MMKRMLKGGGLYPFEIISAVIQRIKGNGMTMDDELERFNTKKSRTIPVFVSNDRGNGRIINEW